jgi:ABC-2 type transport system ATP-binding protein
MRAYTSAGRTVLFATHYLEEAEAFASRVVIISHGRIVADGTVPELKRRFGVHTVRFATPTTDRQALVQLAGVRDMERVAETVTLTTDDADATVRDLMRSAIAWRDIDVRSANLDDIFMTLVGNGERSSNGSTSRNSHTGGRK